ncbi:hypothetical protein [Zhongshania aquimaris]|uniref:hypothetical protein n=1 Tax=Zhongshania aquimaris TaxID=2857107 RepID=UPI001C56D111|nr:hypothetical protein [Zhongshania aquimaris]
MTTLLLTGNCLTAAVAIFKFEESRVRLSSLMNCYVQNSSCSFESFLADLKIKPDQYFYFPFSSFRKNNYHLAGKEALAHNEAGTWQ